MATTPTPRRLILRGLFVDGGTSDAVIPNLMRLSEAVDAKRYDFENPWDREIYQFCSDFFKEHGEPPSFRHFEQVCDLGSITPGVDDTVEDLHSVPLTTYGAYSGTLATELEKWRRNRAAQALGKAVTISNQGVKPEKGPRLEGVEAAFDFVIDSLTPLVETIGRPSRSDVWIEGKEVLEEYEDAKTRKPGLPCGLQPIDQCFGGVRPGELWTHAAFTGQLKTTLALNVVYEATRTSHQNVLYVSLEMPSEQLRRLSYALHSAHFDGPGLNYSAIKEGRLTPSEEERLRIIAGQAAATAKAKLLIWSPAVTPTVQQIGTQAEIIDRQHPVSLIVIDHSGLVKPSSKDRDHYTRMNSVFIDAKRLAIGFARGRGVPVMVLHQINREGFREAQKGKSISLVHLSNTNEAERSSDYITYSWVDDDLRGRNRARLGCLKNREGALFQPFEASVNFPSRRISYEAQVSEDFGFDDHELQASFDKL